MSKKIHVSGNFNNSLATQVLGSIHVAGSKTLQININTTQDVETTPLPEYTLRIYQYKEGYKNLTGIGDNISEMKQIDSIRVFCSSNTNNNDYNNSFSVDCEFLTFTIGNPTNLDLSFKFNAEVFSTSLQNYIVCDKTLELNEEALVVRNVSDYKTDVMGGRQRGITCWNMNCKGELTNTEYLLNNGNFISSMGYFNTNLEQHKANIIIIKSDSANDTISGLGAQKIKITGLNYNFQQMEEIIDLNGTTEVNSVIEYTEVNYASITQSGGLFCNSGNIIMYNADINGGTSSNPQNSICMNFGKHSNPQYCVPNGYELHIQKIHLNNHCEDECELNINKYEWITAGSPPTNINKHILKKIHLHGNAYIECDVNFLIKEHQRITITAQSLVATTGINRVSINLTGYLKLKSLNKISATHKDVGIYYVEDFDPLPQDLPTNY